MAAATTAVIVLLMGAVVMGMLPTWFGGERIAAAKTEVRDVPAAVTTPVGLALTPPMGWNGFNHFYLRVDEATVEAQARALIGSGMAGAGYSFVNLDGGWDLPQRGPDGRLQPVPARFPHGIAALAAYVHSLGLKFGIYTSAGNRNCARTSAGSYGHYGLDAQTFASWGVDYVKLDWCQIPWGDFPHDMKRRDVGKQLAVEMGAALTATGRPIVYDVNAWSDDQAWSWAPPIANLWRTTPDIHDRYASLVWNFTHNVSHFALAGPGRWNDPDMLEIGNGGMSNTEYQAQLSLWAEMAAPLIAGNDLTTMSRATRGILTNGGVIAVDQDPLGLQGFPVASAQGHWVLSKPLANGDRAVVLFNQTDKPAAISSNLVGVGLVAGVAYTLTDLWTGEAGITDAAISAIVAPHGVVMYRVSPVPEA